MTITLTGGRSITLDDISELRLSDVVRSLSRESRWGGFTDEFYSVAEHSVAVAGQCIENLPDYRLPFTPEAEKKQILKNKDLWLAALLHDASECVFKDLMQPVKQFIPEYRKKEKEFQKKIYKHFGINITESIADRVKYADMQVGHAEFIKFFPDAQHDYFRPDVPPATMKIKCFDCGGAQTLFGDALAFAGVRV